MVMSLRIANFNGVEQLWIMHERVNIGNSALALMHIDAPYAIFVCAGQNNMAGTVEYHSSDFNLEDWKEEAGRLYCLPELSSWDATAASAQAVRGAVDDGGDDTFSEHWESFYNKHKSGDFFKPRRYLTVEFRSFLAACERQSTILEVGCGHGCSMFPILQAYPVRYVATDYSTEVLGILRGAPKFNSEISTAVRWDVTLPAPPEVTETIATPLRAIVCVFALSAVHPDLHVQCFVNMRDLLLRHAGTMETGTTTHPVAIIEASDRAGARGEIVTDSFTHDTIPTSSDNSATAFATSTANPSTPPPPPRGVILFRDYGIHDMTMYRHQRRYSETLFGRADGTLAYYFDLPYLRSVVEAAGLHVEELEYATVRTENRKKGSVMHRVFVHGVFSIHLGGAPS